jgi:hypothetical protein
MPPEVSVEHPGIALDSEPSMRCYFHLVNGEEIILDNTGIEVSNLATAKEMALQAIRDIRTEAIQLGASWQGWRLDIVDLTGCTLLSITLDPTIH